MNPQLQDEIEGAVREYLAAHAPGPTPGHDEDLFQSGRVNSLFAIQLMSFLERTFHIELDVDDLKLGNFATIAKITEFVQHKQRASDSV
ncbi:acyl carrier protein [Streptomyces avermitilis]